MIDVTVTQGQSAELDKKLRRAGIKDHKPMQRFLDDKDRFLGFVASLKDEGAVEAVADVHDYEVQDAFLKRLTQKTRQGEIQWVDDGKHFVESNNRWSKWGRTFSGTLDGFTITLTKYIFEYVSEVIFGDPPVYSLQIEKDQESAILKDPERRIGRLFTWLRRRPKLVSDFYGVVNGIFLEECQRKEAENHTRASALSQQALKAMERLS